MMRLPRFRFVAPESVAEAADVLAAASPGEAMIVAGGTDIIPNMKRRQQTPGTLVGLRRIAELRRIDVGDDAVAFGTQGTQSSQRKHSNLTSASFATSAFLEQSVTIGAGVTL